MNILDYHDLNKRWTMYAPKLTLEYVGIKKTAKNKVDIIYRKFKILLFYCNFLQIFRKYFFQ